MDCLSCSLRWFVTALVVVTAAACGGVETDPGQGGAGGGAGGSGGAGGGSAAGGGPAVCGGATGVTCAADEYCDFEPPASCGSATDTGTCAPRPDVCTDDCPGVCGCDGAFYCNECSAHAAGVDVDENASCAPPDATYSAWNLFTHVPRFVIFKADVGRDLCFRLWVELSGPVDLGIQTTAPWGVSRAEVTDHASDCALDMGYPVQPAGNVADAVSGAGTLDVQGSFPCEVTLHGSLSFDPQAVWAPATEALDADALMVDGGCG